MRFGAPAPDSVVVKAADGVSVAVHDLGGGDHRPLILMAHAAGFHGRVWGPVADGLNERFHCFALDFRGHGESETPATGRVDFARLTADVLAAVDHFGGQPCFGVGHSSGATALLLAEAVRPGSLAAIWCWEPAIVPADPPLGPDPDNWLAAATRRRRTTFPSASAALDAYRHRPGFAGVREDVLTAYVTHGLRPDAKGGVELRCSPDLEAQIYETASGHDCFRRLADIVCPVVLARGQESEAFPPATAAAVLRRLTYAREQVLPGLGHLGPLEDPNAVARAIRAALGD